MCFGGSKAKEQKIPPPTPPTTFDYNSDRAPNAQRAAANASEPSAAESAASFGSELGSGPAIPAQG